MRMALSGKPRSVFTVARIASPMQCDMATLLAKMTGVSPRVEAEPPPAGVRSSPVNDDVLRDAL
jgi:hypothetical protein